MSSNLELADDAISDVDGSSLLSDGLSELIDSPADGYFSQRSHPQQLYVQDETTRRAHEAKQVPISSQTTQNPHTSSDPLVWTTEQTPLLDAGPAPPDYYAATASRRASDRDDAHYSLVDGIRNYGSTAAQGEGSSPVRTPRILLQAGLFGAGRAPQSMSENFRPVDEESQPTVVLAERHGESWRRRVRRRPRCCLGLFAMVVILTTIIMIVVSRSDDNTGTPIPFIPTPSPKQPGNDYDLPHNLWPTHPERPDCSYTTFSDSWHYDFKDISDFALEEAVSKSSSVHSLTGSVWIRPAPADQIPDIRVSVSFVTSAGVRILDPKPVISHNSIILETPSIEMTKSHSSFGACIEAGIAVNIKKGLTLEHWTTKTNTFDIHALIGLVGLFDQSNPSASKWFSVDDTSIFETTAGKIDATYWSSRETIIRSSFGSVSGRYALRDLLSISAVSGSISVDVDPKEADEDKPLPAVFKATSRAGSIKATFPIRDELPDRAYETTVDSTYGSIAGTYIHGTQSTFRSKSGSIIGTLLPVQVDGNSTLITNIVDGATNLRILSPNDQGRLKHMRSTHDSRSGSIRLRYPTEWEGSFSGRTTAGRLSVHGPGVEFDLLGDKRTTGRKGTGSSSVEMTAKAGSIDLGIGA